MSNEKNNYSRIYNAIAYDATARHGIWGWIKTMMALVTSGLKPARQHECRWIEKQAQTFT